MVRVKKEDLLTINLFKLNVKIQMIVVLSVLVFIGMFKYGFGITLPLISLTLLSTVILDLAINYLKDKKFFFPSSAIISGLIIGSVLAPGQNYSLALIASAIAIASKHIIRLEGRHIFNPANFGLFSAGLLLSATFSWWGSSFPPLVILFGLFIAYRMKRFHLMLSFLITYAILMSLYSLLTRQPVLNNILLANLYFIFFMLIEPKTSPMTRKGRVIYGALTALFASTFIAILPKYDPSLLALVSADIFVPVLNRMESNR